MNKKKNKMYCPLCDKETETFVVSAYLPETYCKVCKNNFSQACLLRSFKEGVKNENKRRNIQ